MNVLIAKKQILSLPDTGNEPLIIIADDACTAPLSLFSKGIRTYFLPEKSMTDASVGILLGQIVIKEKATEVVLYGEDGLIKPYAGLEIGGCVFVSHRTAKKPSAAARRTKEKAPIKSEPSSKIDIPRSGAGEKPLKRKKSSVPKDNKIPNLLSSVGIRPELHEVATQAIRDSSDAKLGLPVTLQMGLVLAGFADEDVGNLCDMISPIYDKVKSMLEV